MVNFLQYGYKNEDLSSKMKDYLQVFIVIAILNKSYHKNEVLSFKVKAYFRFDDKNWCAVLEFEKFNLTVRDFYSR